MSRPLRGVRYAEGASPTIVGIIGKLPYWSFNEAEAFYQELGEKAASGEVSGKDIALLGCNDRYFLLTRLCRRVDGIHPWIYDRCREVEQSPDGHLDLWSRYHYKMVAVSELVPTPIGWRKHGDLKPGDEVFGPDGRPTRVVARTQVWTDGECYRATFDKGYSVVVGAEHLWTVNISSKKRLGGNRREGRREVTLTTKQLMAEVNRTQALNARVLPSIPVCAPLQYPPAVLPIDPYVLGCWLGDGTSSNGAITCGDDVWPEIEKSDTLGHDMTPHRSSQYRAVRGLMPRLRHLDLLDNKHIPGLYEFSGVEQRQRLLQGLMDTDGHCDTRGTATFVNVNAELAHGVFRLASGLGLKPSIRSVSGLHKGQPYPYYQVSFQARADADPVFTLPRKLARATQGAARRSTRHMIVSVEPVDPEPCSCIQVERPDGLYLVGEHCIATHNSSIITFAGVIQEILCDPEIRVGIFSNTKEIAHPFVAQIKEELEGNEQLINVYPDVLWQSPAERKAGARTWAISEGITVKRRGNPREATVEGHGLIEALPTGKHFNLLVYDDVINERNVTNPEQVKKATERMELSFNLGVGEGTRKWFIGTRYHFGDTYAYILEHQIADPRIKPATDDGSIKGNPVFLSPEAWAKVLREQRSSVAAQMLQNPRAGQENVFETAWLKPYWERPAMMNVYIMGDPSRGHNKTSDRTAIVVIGIDPLSNKYLLDGYCHRMQLKERWERVRDLYKKWSAMPGVQLVKVGWERYGMQSDDEYFRERMRIENYWFSIEEINWTGERGGEAKKYRVERLEPDFRGGSFFVPGRVWHPARGNDEHHWARWFLEDGSDEIKYRPCPGLHAREKAAKNAGAIHRLFDPIRRIDEDGGLYDLTRVFFEEFALFPFATRDDLIDATSRIYDMDPMPAVQFEQVEPESYPDD